MDEFDDDATITSTGNGAKEEISELSPKRVKVSPMAIPNQSTPMRNMRPAYIFPPDLSESSIESCENDNNNEVNNLFANESSPVYIHQSAESIQLSFQSSQSVSNVNSNQSFNQSLNISVSSISRKHYATQDVSHYEPSHQYPKVQIGRNETMHNLNVQSNTRTKLQRKPLGNLQFESNRMSLPPNLNFSLEDNNKKDQLMPVLFPLTQLSTVSSQPLCPVTSNRKRISTAIIENSASSKRAKVQESRFSKETITQMILAHDERLTFAANLTPLTRAVCWDKFNLILVDNVDQRYAHCTNCHSIYDIAKSQSQLNHSRHDNILCEKAAKSFEKKRAEYLKSHRSGSNQSSMAKSYTPLSQQQQQKLLDLSAMVCANGMRPFTLFNEKTFRYLLQYMCHIGDKNGCVPMDECLPKDRAISKRTEDLYNVVKGRMIEEISLAANFAVTTDHWTRTNKGKHFLGVNLHYEINGVLKCRQLTIAVVPNKKCEDAANKTQEIIAAFGVDRDKVGGYVSDGALESAYAQSEKGEPRPWVTDKQHWFWCAAHLMILTNAHLFNRTYHPEATFACDQIDVCKDICRYARKSGLNVQLKRTLKQEADTRWDSKHKMFTSILSNLGKLNDKAKKNTKLKVKLSRLDIPMINDLTNYLSNWLDLRLYLCSETQPTLCRVWPTQNSLRKESIEILTQSNRLRNLRSALIFEIEQTFQIDIWHKVATFLWPFYRNYDEITSNILENIIDEIEKIYDDNQCRFTQNSGPQNVPPMQSKLPAILAKHSQFSKSIGGRTLTLREEVQQYTDPTMSPDLIEMPIFAFWHRMEIRWPILSQVALMIHVIPATEVDTERGFNLAGLTLTKNRERLGDNRFDQSSTIKKNSDLLSDYLEDVSEISNSGDIDENDDEDFEQEEYEYEYYIGNSE